MLKRLIAGTAIATVSVLPLADFATATGKKPSKGDQTCTSRGANKGGTCNTTGGGGGGNTGNKVDDCDNRTDGVHIISGQAVTCNDFDVVVDVL